jgi:hypothetical protein
MEARPGELGEIRFSYAASSLECASHNTLMDGCHICARNL